MSPASDGPFSVVEAKAVAVQNRSLAADPQSKSLKLARDALGSLASSAKHVDCPLALPGRSKR